MHDRKLALCVLLLLAVSISARIYEIDRPYETWDEISRYTDGLNSMYNIFHGYYAPEYWELNAGHPPVGKYIYGAVNGAYLALTSPGIFSANSTEAIGLLYEGKNIVPGRYASAAMGAIAVLATFAISYRFVFKGNKRAALMAGLILSLLPLFLAHTRLANLDSPSVMFSMLSIWMFMEMERKDHWKFFALFSLFTGLAIATKFTSAVVFFVIAAYMAVGKIRGRKTFHWSHALLWVAISALILYASWPWLWQDPVGNFMRSAGVYAGAAGLGPSEGAVTETIMNEYFLGSISPPGLGYYPAYFVFTTPLIILVLVLLGLRAFVRERSSPMVLIILMLVIPFIIASAVEFKVNGMKYLLVTYPAVAILAAAGLESVSRLKRLKWLPFALVAAYVILSAAIVHPYYLDYYNELSLGPGNVHDSRLFIIGYWGEGLGEAIDYVNQHAEPGSTLRIFAEPMHVAKPVRDDIRVFDAFVPNYAYNNGLVERDSYYKCSPGGWCLYEPETNSTKSDYVIVNTYYEWYIDPGITGSLNGYEKAFSSGVLGAELAGVYESV